MKFYSVKLKDTEICFSDFKEIKKFINVISFSDRFTVSKTGTDDFKYKINIKEIKECNCNFIYSSVCMNLDSKNHNKFNLEMSPIIDSSERLSLPDRAYYSILRKNKEGNLKSKSEVYINEQDNYIKLDLYIPINKFSCYITKKVIIERLYKQIEKYRKIYISKKFIKLKTFENQYNNLLEDLKKFLFLKGYKRQIIETCLKLVEYSKERNKRFSEENRINSIKKLIEQIKEIESKGLILPCFELISDLIREGNKNDNG